MTTGPRFPSSDSLIPMHSPPDLRKPLYMVGAADLGTDHQSVDRTLMKVMNLVMKWGAVLLIDEADVFLEKRSLKDLERNAMVAVFLRRLE